MMRSAVAVILAAGILVPLDAQAAKEASGLNALGAYLGVWHGQGVAKGTPYSKAANDSAETTCNWSPNHGFLLCDQIVHTPEGTTQNDLSIYTYNEKAHAYAFFGLSRDDSHVRAPKLTINGKRWIYLGQFDDGGKHIQFRTVNDFTSATAVTYRAEYSEDGSHWKYHERGNEHESDLSVSGFSFPLPASGYLEMTRGVV